MAGDPGLDISWNLSNGISNADADISVGGDFSNHRVDTTRTTIAAVAAAGATRVFLATVFSLTQNGFLAIRDGAAGGFFSRVVGQDMGAGWVDLLDPLPFAVGIGDATELYIDTDDSMPFGVATAAESSAGFTQYCALYITSSGLPHSGFGVYIDEVSPGPIEIEIAVASDPTPPLLNLSPDNVTAPDLSNMMTGGLRGSFSRPLQYAMRVPNVTWSSTFALGIWIKATSPPNVRRQTDQVVALVAADSGTLRANLVLHLGAAGFTPDLTLRQSPSLYIRGGAQFRANVKSVETGLVVEGIPVAMRKASGPGTFYPPAAPAETDALGNAIGHYTAPTDIGDIGQVVTVEAEV